MIKLIKTRHAAEEVLDDALEGHPEYYAVVQVTNAMGENIWFVTSGPEELQSILKKAEERVPKTMKGQRAPEPQHQRTAEILWTKDAGLTEDGELFMPGEPEDSLWTSVVDADPMHDDDGSIS